MGKKNIKLEAENQQGTFMTPTKSKVKEEPGLNNNLEEDGRSPSKKPRHEKFLLAKNYHFKKEVIESENAEDDFSQYKHKKIRRNSKDFESFKALGLDFPENIMDKEITAKMKMDKKG